MDKLELVENNIEIQHKMIRTKLVILLILTMAKTVSGQQNARLEAALSDFIEKQGYPGAMVSIVKADSILFIGGLGYADRATETPVSTTQLFRLGSISKSFTALALVKLLSEKGWSLDTPIEKIDPSIPFENRWSTTSSITVASLLEHSAGFDDYHAHAMYATDEVQPPMSEFVQAHTNSLYTRWPPNTRHAYSNSGYVVAGHLIEVLSGQPYSEYI